MSAGLRQFVSFFLGPSFCSVRRKGKELHLMWRRSYGERTRKAIELVITGIFYTCVVL